MSEKFKAVVIDNQNEKFSRDIKEIDKSGVLISTETRMTRNSRMLLQKESYQFIQNCSN